jgi:Uma2 family endonuclease
MQQAHDQRWTIDDLELFPQPLDDKRYEIIAGELHVSTQPHWMHQLMSTRVIVALGTWSEGSGGGLVVDAPGVIFAKDEAVAPDVAWVSGERLARVLGGDGKLHAAPDLVVEILSAGGQNEHRDRVQKLELYSRRGVEEYWIVDWRDRRLEVHRRRDAALRHAATLKDGEFLESPLLPGLRLDLARLFGHLPETQI